MHRIVSPCRVASAAVLGCAFLLAACSKPAEDVAAKVGDLPITVGEFTEAYAQTFLQAGLTEDNPVIRGEVLQSLINRLLVVQAAREAGIEQTPEYAAELERARLKMLVEAYVHRTLYDTIRVRESELRENFRRANTAVTARHLFAPTLAGAERLRERLDAGESFAALAREVFRDPELRDTGGFLGTFEHDDMDPAIENAAHTIPIGEVSQPIRTARGYSLLLVEHRSTQPILTETDFARRNPQIARYVRRRKQTEVRFLHSQDILDRVSPSFNDHTVDRLASVAAGVALVRPNEESWLTRPIVSYTPLGGSEVRTWTVGDIERLGSLATEDQVNAVDSRDALVDFIRGLIVRETILDEARSPGYDRLERYDWAVEEAMRRWIFTQEQDRLRRTFVPGEDTLRAHYAAHTVFYEQPERVRVREILLSSRAEAQSVVSSLRGGARFEQIAATQSQRPGAAASGGDLGFVTAEQLGDLAPPVFAASPGQILGPIQVADHFVVLRVEAREASRPMTFAEARPHIIQDIEMDIAQAELRRYVRGLRDRFRVRVNDQVVGRVRVLT
ncbi:hypothetical protein BH23BAC4_BH23BAC4_02700 [soil metagenome]